MPPIELDKPPKGPISSDRAENDDLVIHDRDTDSRHGTTVRDPSGKIVYPSYVPPDVELPTTSPQRPADPTDSAAQASQADPQNTGSNARGRSKKPRPLFNKFLTDLPKSKAAPHATTSTPGRLLNRANTNTSVLHNAILQAQEANNLDDSSSSSSDEDEERSGTHGGASRKRNKGLGQAKARPLEGKYRRFRVGNENFDTRGNVSRKDGRLNIILNDTSDTGYLAKTLGAAIQRLIPRKQDQQSASSRPTSPTRPSSISTPEAWKIPKLNIVIMVIGSRGDAQPFLKIGKVLKEYGHRVRIATHPAFRDFVEKDCGLEFFSVGGDPSELMAFMVKNPGMIPKLETVKAGDVGRRRAAMAEMFEGFWRACVNATDDKKAGRKSRITGERGPFIADAIIANPPSFAHIHCAEALGIPLHLMFTFPYTPTQAFPHPLANIKKTNVDPGYTNFISYPLVEMMVWQGLGDLVNDFRVKTLGLDPIHTLWAPGSIYRLQVPFTYLWSPALVSKPEDWGHQIDISGYVFLDLASSFKPPKELVEFLEAGEQPIYIGFGSIVVDDANKFTEMIFEAVERAGVRALVSKGWGGLGQDKVPDNIYMLENTPHDWLFPRVRACVIHGGAGTTAIALKCGKPTMIVPFFGDQSFWGSMVARAKAGPEPVPYKQLSAEKLAEGIKYCLTEEASAAAKEISASIEAEGDGAENAVRAFHHHLRLSGEESMRCSVFDDHVAAWVIKGTDIRLSPLAANIAVREGLVSWKVLRPLRHKGWNDFEGPGEPLTGITSSLMGTVGDLLGGIGSLPYRLAKASNRRSERHRRQRRRLSKTKLYVNSHKGLSRSPSSVTRRGSSPDASGNATTASAATPGTASVASHQNEYFEELQEGVGKSGRALARAPVDFSLALAQGFHNAPRLYGDETVRQPIRVTGISSGLKAARNEFLYGIYDGFTGLVLLPIRGAKEGGFKGAIAGIGMGLLGFVLKDLAAIFGPIAYTLQGIAKEISGGKRHVNHIRRARIVQAQREIEALSDSDKKTATEEVRRAWAVMKQLACMVMEDRERRGAMGIIRRGTNDDKAKKNKALEKYGRGRAFESAETAKMAIAALEGGKSMDEVVGRDTDLPTLSRSKKNGESERGAAGDREESENRLVAGASVSP
ncbi:glycosyltransferase family 1 protein [Xylariaceae sp. FL0594]|nr:glycosyltransferase family 1 protein [Xylariaceae sp. FL0594]